MRVALIHQHDCHSVIKTYARSIHADFYPLKNLPIHPVSGVFSALYLALTMSSYPVYFTDSAMSNFVPIFKRWFGEKNRIIFRGGDGIFGEKSTAYLYTKNPFKKKVLLYLLHRIDGVITESEMAKRDAEHWVKCPVAVAPSYVRSLTALLKLKPREQNSSFLFIGEYRPPYDHKGVALLIDAFNLLRGKNIYLTIIGKHTSLLQPRVTNANITIKDYVSDLTPYFTQSTFYIHPARYETGPITILEAMAAGLVPLVSTTCGHSDLVKNISPDLLLPSLDAHTLAHHIENLLTLKKAQIASYSQKGKTLVRPFTQENMSSHFKEEFLKLVQHQVY